MKILLAEDDHLIRMAIEMKLKASGHEVYCSADGKDAIEKLERHLPDLLITDLMMPYYNGLEVAARAKKMTTKTCKVMILSSMGTEQMIEEAFTLGIDDFLRKPFSVVELMLRVKILATHT